jgi:non-canonical purine NTP pyrophosphatase (RdgB/HAM1 family)
MTVQHKMIWNEAKDYMFIALGLAIYTVAFTVFLMPYQIVAGGVTGLSAIIYYATGFHLENTYIIINGLLLIAALKILGVRFLMKTIFAIFTLYFMLMFAQEIMPKQENGLPFKLMGEGQDFMSMIIGCAMTGIALATVFTHNGSTGGTDIIAASINKFHPNVTLGNVLIAADFCIIGSCMFFPQFGTYMERAHKVMFGFCVMALENYTLDYVMNARRQSVQFMIFSKKWQEIANAIGTTMNHGVTILDGHGWYTGHQMKVLCILAKKNESINMFRLIKMIDPNAFVSQSSVIGVYGEGFDEMHVKIKEDKKMKIVFATNNLNKLTEVRKILGNAFEVLSLNDIKCNDDIPEKGQTLEDNARLKAEYIYNKYHINCFADDTGLEVEALGGAPGVYSARYASMGEEHAQSHDSGANMTRLLRELEQKDNRKARFRTIIALMIDGNITTFEGIVNGEITRERRGGEGFGYDPIFKPEGYSQTFAEMGTNIKNQISHRARATQKLANYLKKVKI